MKQRQPYQTTYAPRSHAPLAAVLTTTVCLLAAGSHPATALGGGSPFYDLKVVAEAGDAVAGNDVTETYISFIDPAVAGNDSGRVAFQALVGNSGSNRFWNVLVANTSTTGGLHRLTDIDTFLDPFDPENYYPGQLFEQFHLNNSSTLVAASCLGPTLDLPYNCAFFTHSADVVGGSVSNTTSSRNFIFSPLCSDCISGQAPNPCNDGHGVAMDDADRVVLAITDSTEQPSCVFTESDPNVLYLNDDIDNTNINWSPITTLLPGLAGSGSPMAGAGPTTVLKEGGAGSERIVRVTESGAITVLASASGGWSNLGPNPGISSDGTVAAFGGAPSNGTAGIYVRVFHPQWPSAANVLASGSNTVVGVDDGPNIVHFASFDFQSDRIPIIRHDVGADGLIVGDRLVIAFIATPTAASLENPSLPEDDPLLFTGQKGLWTLELDIQRELAGAGNIVINPRGVRPVLQVGDTVNGDTVTDVRLWNGLGRGTVEQDGLSRLTIDGEPTPGDHYLAFWVDSTGGPKALRADLLDRDNDGLPDHWEYPGGGIDIDRDGVVDLSLNDWGASADQKDLFLEADWLKERTVGVTRPWSARPNSEIFRHAARFFEIAPIPNPDGSTGVVLHVDAGPGVDPASGITNSYNTGAGSLDGGEEISGSFGASLDIVHMGPTFAHPASGVQTRSLDTIKRSFFGTNDKRARELAFRYVLFAESFDLQTDTNNMTYIGQVAWASPTRVRATTPIPTSTGIIKITEGTGAGQVRSIDVINSASNQICLIRPWSTVPDSTSRFVLPFDSSGQAEAFFQPPDNNHSLPGNDLLVTMGGFGQQPNGRFANPLFLLRTLLHEFGHTVGLRHGGTNQCQFAGDRYLSIMNYSHQLRVFADEPVHFKCYPPFITVSNLPVVPVYGLPGDPTFNDYAALELSPHDRLSFVGNSYMLAGGAPYAREFGIMDYLETFGHPPDIQPPVIDVLFPGAETNLALGVTLDVVVEVRDESPIESVQIGFDIDGDGTTNGTGELVAALPVGGDQYLASFPGLGGAPGPRTVWIEALDEILNRTRSAPKVYVGAGDSGDTRRPLCQFPYWPPGSDVEVEEGSWVAAVANAVDNRDNLSEGVVDRVIITLDADGDGSIGDDEIRRAQPLDVDNYEALFPPISGSPATRTVTVMAWDDWSNLRTVTRTLDILPRDPFPPSVTITSPVSGAGIQLGDTLTVDVLATDNDTVSEVTVFFDVGGNGTIQACESVTANSIGGGVYRAVMDDCFIPVSGSPGIRTVRASARDGVGNTIDTSIDIEVLPDVTPPTVSFADPRAGDLLGVGQSLTVDVILDDLSGIQSAQVAFDLDGDGTPGGAGETATAFLYLGQTYRASFGTVSGPAGSRSMIAAATDPHSNAMSATQQVDIVVGGRILGPVDSGRAALDGTFAVEIEAAPGLNVDTVLVRFDLNDDGDTDDLGETVEAFAADGDNRYRASFSDLGGDAGVRMVEVAIIETGSVTNDLDLALQVLAPSTFLGVRSEHLGWVPHLPETAADGTGAHGSPDDFVVSGPYAYFRARDGVSGRELWRTDGTGRGTRMLGQVAPSGTSGDLNGSAVREMTSYRERLYFGASDDVYGAFSYNPPDLVGLELYVTEGLPGDLQLVRELGGTNGPPRNGSPEYLTLFQDKIWFVADDDAFGTELRCTEGTRDTTDVFDLSPGPADSKIKYLAATDSALFFATNDSMELWKTDGTMPGTTRVYGGFPLYAISQIQAANHRVFFEKQAEIWVSDGTSNGTYQVKDINPGGGAFPEDLTTWGSNLYFSADDGTHGRELWRTDGTSNGTFMVVDAFPGGGNGNPTDLTVFNGFLYFAANDLVRGRELWRTDGTTSGTVVTVDLAPFTGPEPFGAGYPSPSSSPQYILPYAGKLYFSADDGQGRFGRELYRTDGTQEGTSLVRDLTPTLTNISFNTSVPLSSNPRPLGVLDGDLFFMAENPYRLELWRTDGTAQGTTLVRNLYPGAPDPISFAGGGFFFPAADQGFGSETWHLGSEGVRRALDLEPGWRGSDPTVMGTLGTNAVVGGLAYSGSSPYRVYHVGPAGTGGDLLHAYWALGHVLFPPRQLPNGLIVFRAQDTHGEEPWVTDGTVTGTVELADIYPGSTGSTPTYPQVIGDEVYFSAKGASGWQIWRTDGTVTGSVMVADINPGTTASKGPDGYTELNGKVLFVGYQHGPGWQIWAVDGSGSSVEQLSSAGPGVGLLGVLHPSSIYQGHLYFGMEDSLWKTDGTSNGTVQVDTVEPWVGGSGITRYRQVFQEAGGYLFFTGHGQGRELHRTDGTSNGTIQVSNIVGLDPTGSYEDSSEPQQFAELNGLLIFTAFDYDHGRELWGSDGSPGGAYLLKDILPGYPSSGIREMKRIGHLLYFVANDGRHGHELWVTDGTTAGTVLYEELLPGPMSSQPSQVQVRDDVLHYYADAGGHDLSLRRLDPSNNVFDAWLDAETSLTGSDRALMADPGGNGLPNLYDYLLGLDPEGSNAVVVVADASVGTDPGTGSPRVTFSLDRRRAAPALGLDLVVEVSADLDAWTTARVLETSVDPIDADFERVTFAVLYPPESGLVRFARYRLVMP